MSKLFEPIKLGNYILKHRVVLAPLTRCRATMEGVPTSLMTEYYGQRASDGGLMITEATQVHPVGRGYPGSPGIYSKDQIEGWKKITEAVHAKNAFIFSQIWHAGRTSSSNLIPKGEQIVSASAIPMPGKDYSGNDFETPRALKIDEIKQVVQDFKQASINAMEAGFDGVEIHNATGYLLDQFINTSSNQRNDEYGGSVENRARLTLEVVDAVVEAVGPERTGIRFSPGSPIHGMHDENVVETWSYVTKAIQEKHPNLAYVHFIEIRTDNVESFTVEDVSLEPFRKIWKGPFITSGGFSNDIGRAKELANNTGSLISFGRAFIANPDLPERIKNDIEFNKYDRSTFYANTAAGYTDYPFHT